MSVNARGAAFLAVGTALLVASVLLAAANALMASVAANPSPQPAGEAARAIEGGGEPAATLEQEGFRVDWDYWKSVNPDVVGWVDIPGTAVSQPIVQAHADDPQYYLKHDVHRNWNPYGCPYLDAGCEDGMESWNLAVMGHNISTPPAMFHDLQAYRDPSYALDHLRVDVYTPAGARTFAVAGVNTVDGSSPIKRVKFDDERDFANYRDERLAECDGRYAPNADCAQMLTLCSCSYFLNPRNERTLVYALSVQAPEAL